MPLSDALKKHMLSRNLSIAAAAKASGLSEPTIRRAIKGGLPNSPTIPGFAKLLGVPAPRVRAMVMASKDQAAQAPASKQAPAASFKDCIDILNRASALLEDELALRVHGMGKRERGAIAAVVQSLS